MADPRIDRAVCRLGALTALVLASLLASSCAERKAHLAASQEQVLLAQAPAPAHPLAIRFADKVELIGYDVEPLGGKPPAPEQTFKLIWYWKVLAPLAEGYQVFTHVADAAGRTQLNLDAERAMRAAYPEAKWKAGDFIKDVQPVTLPTGWTSPEARFYLGFYRGAKRLEITRGPHDGERRADALRLPIAIKAAPVAEPQLPELVAKRAARAPTLDGKLNEPEWEHAADSGKLVNTMTGGPGSFGAQVKLLYDATSLYAAFVVEDDFLKARYTNADDHLWEEDTVEIMLDPDGDAKNYFELQVSPRGTRFDTRYESPRQPRPFGHVAWDSQLKAGVQLDGKLDDNEADGGYTVEIAIPWASFAVGEPPAKPPVAGDSWRINFFVMDARERGQRAVGWSAPRVGDFHTLARFGRVRFE